MSEKGIVVMSKLWGILSGGREPGTSSNPRRGILRDIVSIQDFGSEENDDFLDWTWTWEFVLHI